LQGLLSFLKGLGAARMAAMAAVTLALVGFFGFVIMRVTTPPMTTLFTDLSTKTPRRSSRTSRQGFPTTSVTTAPSHGAKDKVTRCA